MIQAVESRGRKKKRNKRHNNWKTQNKRNKAYCSSNYNKYKWVKFTD